MQRQPAPSLPSPSLGSPRAVIAALLTGQLRRQFYSDTTAYGEVPDAARQVAAGYLCLGAALAWLISTIATFIFNPAHWAAPALGGLNTVLNLGAFLQLRRRRDPRPMLDWLIAFDLITIMVVAFGHSGLVAPIVFNLPVVAGVAALYQRPHMRTVSAALGVVAMGVCLLAALGEIGRPSTYTPDTYVVVAFITLAATTLGLGGLAWISVVVREYALDRLKIANDAIVDSAARARVALEAARVGLWDVPDAAKPRFDVSESFVSVTGYTDREFSRIFGNIEKFVHADDIQTLRDAFQLGRTRQSRIRVDFRLLTKSRGYRWFSARARYSQNPDGTTRISGSLQDINFVKVAEDALRAGRDQARAANKAKSDFIAVMSHEVRTPLNAILGSVEVLKRGVPQARSAEMIDLIEEAGRGLLAIVNDLLDVSRIDAGKLDISLAPTDVVSLVRRTVDFWRPQANHKGLALHLDSSASEDVNLMLDAGRLRQIIGNLISNAIKFTDQGHVSTRVAVRDMVDGRVRIDIDVIDTGPGVPAGVVERVFEAFEQAPGDSSRGGAGLGLFISRRLARLMDGELTLQPAVTGAHFRLSLAADRAGAASPPSSAPAVEPSTWLGLQVLCVDDNDKNRRIAELLLGNLGFSVTLAASGAETLDVCAEQQFDLILMDIVMPDLDGIETLQRLRRDGDGPNRATPAIALTAKVAPDNFDSYVMAGFDGVSAKPIQIAELTREIARVLAGRIRE